jgi:hypothetical protein
MLIQHEGTLGNEPLGETRHTSSPQLVDRRAGWFGSSFSRDTGWLRGAVAGPPTLEARINAELIPTREKDEREKGTGGREEYEIYQGIIKTSLPRVGTRSYMTSIGLLEHPELSEKWQYEKSETEPT